MTDSLLCQEVKSHQPSRSSEGCRESDAGGRTGEKQGRQSKKGHVLGLQMLFKQFEGPSGCGAGFNKTSDRVTTTGISN